MRNQMHEMRLGASEALTGSVPNDFVWESVGVGVENFLCEISVIGKDQFPVVAVLVQHRVNLLSDVRISLVSGKKNQNGIWIIDKHYFRTKQSRFLQHVVQREFLGRTYR